MKVIVNPIFRDLVTQHIPDQEKTAPETTAVKEASTAAAGAATESPAKPAQPPKPKAQPSFF